MSTSNNPTVKSLEAEIRDLRKKRDDIMNQLLSKATQLKEIRAKNRSDKRKRIFSNENLSWEFSQDSLNVSFSLPGKPGIIPSTFLSDPLIQEAADAMQKPVREKFLTELLELWKEAEKRWKRKEACITLHSMLERVAAYNFIYPFYGEISWDKTEPDIVILDGNTIRTKYDSDPIQLNTKKEIIEFMSKLTKRPEIRDCGIIRIKTIESESWIEYTGDDKKEYVKNLLKG